MDHAGVRQLALLYYLILRGPYNCQQRTVADCAEFVYVCFNTCANFMDSCVHKVECVGYVVAHSSSLSWLGCVDKQTCSRMFRRSRHHQCLVLRYLIIL